MKGSSLSGLFFEAETARQSPLHSLFSSGFLFIWFLLFSSLGNLCSLASSCHISSVDDISTWCKQDKVNQVPFPFMMVLVWSSLGAVCSLRQLQSHLSVPEELGINITPTTLNNIHI